MGRVFVNHLIWVYIVGLALYHFVGAGVWGFIHTLPPINYYTHGSQVTVSHGHMAFFGAYALLNLTVFYFAMPQFKGSASVPQNWVTVIRFAKKIFCCIIW